MGRLLGPLVVVLGAAGLVASVVGLFVIWIVSRRMSRATLDAFQKSQTALGLLAEKVRGAQTALAAARESLVSLVAFASRLAQTGQLPTAADEARVSEAGQRIGERVAHLQQFLPYCEGAIAFANNAASALRFSVFGFLGRDLKGLPFGSLEGTAAALAEAAARLRRLGALALELFRSARVADAVTQIASLAGETDAAFNVIEGQLRQASQRFDAMPLEAANWQGRGRFWLQNGALLGTAALLWIGLGQAALLARGIALCLGR